MPEPLRSVSFVKIVPHSIVSINYQYGESKTWPWAGGGSHWCERNTHRRQKEAAPLKNRKFTGVDIEEEGKEEKTE